MSTKTLAAFGAAVGTVVVGAFVFTTDHGGTVRGGVDPFMLAVALVWAAPLWLLARFARTPVALVGEVVLAGASYWALDSIYASQSSTSAIGLVTWPVLLFPFAALLIGVDGLVAQRATGAQLLTGIMRRAVGVALCFVVAVAALLGLGGVSGLFHGRTDAPALLSLAVLVAIVVTGTRGIRRLFRADPYPKVRDPAPLA